MFGAICGGIMLDIMKREGYMQQLPLFLTPPKFKIDEKYLTDVFDGYTIEDNGDGKNSGLISNTNHPAFKKLRDVLENKGYIKTQRNYSNGDRVVHAFYLNDVLFQEGEQFSCAAALGNTFRCRAKKPELYETEFDSPYLPVRIPYNETVEKEESDWV